MPNKQNILYSINPAVTDPCMHLAFQIIQTYVTILFLLILDFQSTATAQGIMKTFIAEFALICCSQLKLCQSKVFNIKYDEFP